MNDNELIKNALKAKENAYAKYSAFRVGAALLTREGKIHLGANVEIGSLGATSCAENVAFVKAITEGDKNFFKIAIASDSNDFIYPCGNCRQIMNEFCDEDFTIICSNSSGEYKTVQLKDLLPYAFKFNSDK